MKSLFTFVFIIGFFSCSSKKQETDNNSSDSFTIHPVEIIDTSKFEYEDYFKLDSYLSKFQIKDHSFEEVDFDCAILVYPTDIQIEEMKKENGELDFYTIADDNQYYQATAIRIIDSIGIKKITVSKQFLRLIVDNKTWDLDLRKKNLPPWNIIFFKKTKEPEIISTIDLTVEQAKQFFELK